MNKLLTAVVLLSFGTAYAQSGKSDKPTAPASGTTAAPPAGGETMMPAKPGPETEALKPFAHSVTSTGTMTGPDGKEMPTKGKSTCKWIMNNLWVQCDIEDTAGTGKTAMKWMGHMMYGWDVMQKGYRGVMIDNMGTMVSMKGTLEGTKLVWETPEMKAPAGMPSKMRFTIDAADPKSLKFTEEGYMNGKWSTHGTATHKVSGK